MQTLTLRPSFLPPTTEIFIGKHILKTGRLKDFCKSLGSKIVIISDARVKDLYGVSLAKTLQGELLTIPDGEQAKTKQIQESIIDTLFHMNCGKDTVLVALGGGITTDLVGFISSIYKRGVPLVLIPTTLLAIVDAAIGGKTAINTPFGKNLIGTLYHPKAIFADLATLSTLSEKEWMNGIAEILKMGLIFDSAIWEIAKKNLKDIQLISRAIQGKITIVEQDPWDKSLRHILNFGHTIGHALELLSQYKISHGEAVALGSVVESHLSMRLGYLSSQDFSSIQHMYRPFHHKLPSLYSRESFFAALSHDKKRQKNEIRFVCIDQIGHAVPFENTYCRAVSVQELEPTLLWMEKTYGISPH